LGFLDSYEGEETVDVGNGYWIKVKKCLSSAEYKKVQAFFGAGRQTVTVGSSMSAQINPSAGQDELLLQSITAWNLDDADGTVWPLEPEKEKRASIGRLPSSVFMQIYQVCDEFNGPRKDAEAAQFPDEAVGGDPDGDDPAA
jgi:hypothetical protein